MEWNADKTLNLIEMYRERPLLWDNRLADYKNRNKRHDALLKISVCFGTDKDEIEKKIRYLLSHFAREIKREKKSAKSGTSTSDRYKSRWFAYNSLLFLKDKNKPAATLGTEGKRKLEQEGVEELKKGQENCENQDDEIEHSQRQSPKKFTSPKKNPVTPKRFKNVHINTPIINEAVNLMRSISSNKLQVEKDEYSLFGEQVAMKLRKIASPYAKFFAQNTINNVLFEAEMGKFDNRPIINHHYQPAPMYGFVSPTPINPQQYNFTASKSLGNSYTNTFIPSPSTSTQGEWHCSDGSTVDTCGSVATTNENRNAISDEDSVQKFMTFL